MKPRLTQWRGGLNEAIGRHRGQPFAWGTHDCGTLAGDAVLAVIGVDPAEPFRGHYSSKDEAEAALKGAGYADHVAVAAALFDEVHPAFARVGDLAVVSSEFGPALGVVTGPVVHVFAQTGVGSVPLTDAVRAFKVGL